ncbi:hypothetical protein DPMN_078112 [Dreissena polymorpha]|uniref:Uncharacterized protein n=1 Tax=Dreissena polymorpha TaxID=45954 RepID=A0A9D4BNW5_DREPO|nr:hypothetical protein DPMN_078112 [Dreissena polymorpha]
MTAQAPFTTNASQRDSTATTMRITVASRRQVARRVRMGQRLEVSHLVRRGGVGERYSICILGC